MKDKNEFIKIAIDKQNEIANGEYTHQKYLIFREWFFRQFKNVSRRVAAQSFAMFDLMYGLDVPIKNTNSEDEI
jgi:hypothetical protein